MEERLAKIVKLSSTRNSNRWQDAVALGSECNAWIEEHKDNNPPLKAADLVKASGLDKSEVSECIRAATACARVPWLQEVPYRKAVNKLALIAHKHLDAFDSEFIAAKLFGRPSVRVALAGRIVEADKKAKAEAEKAKAEGKTK